MSSVDEPSAGQPPDRRARPTFIGPGFRPTDRLARSVLAANPRGDGCDGCHAALHVYRLAFGLLALGTAAFHLLNLSDATAGYSTLRWFALAMQAGAVLLVVGARTTVLSKEYQRRGTDRVEITPDGRSAAGGHGRVENTRLSIDVRLNRMLAAIAYQLQAGLTPSGHLQFDTGAIPSAITPRVADERPTSYERERRQTRRLTDGRRFTPWLRDRILKAVALDDENADAFLDLLYEELAASAREGEVQGPWGRVELDEENHDLTLVAAPMKASVESRERATVNDLDEFDEPVKEVES